MPPLRYGHTQTLINDKTIVILGGFDSLSGEAVSLADIWLYDIDTNQWSHLEAKLDKDNKPASRSSHSQVLMPDGISILMQVLISCNQDFLLTLDSIAMVDMMDTMYTMMWQCLILVLGHGQSRIRMQQFKVVLM